MLIFKILSDCVEPICNLLDALTVIIVNSASLYRGLADLIDAAWRQASRDNACNCRPRRTRVT
jgi:hypothetical protein